MADKNEVWDELNLTYKKERRLLLNQLKALDVWYQEQFVLLDIVPSSEGRRLGDVK